MRQKFESAFFTLETLAEGVYAAIANKGAGAMSNAGFIDMGDYTLVFDTFTTPAAARELKKAADELIGNPVKKVINSHYHGDHTFGNQVFEDADIIATELTKQLHAERNAVQDLEKERIEMREYLDGLMVRAAKTPDSILKYSIIQQYEEISHVANSLSELKLVLPNVLFENSLEIIGSKRRVELYCHGGGHTPSDAYLFLPDEKIAFMGDLVLEDLHPPIHSTKAFLENLDKVKQHDIEVIVPGHGNVVSKNQIAVMQTYLNKVITRATDALNKNIPLEELVEEMTPEEYAHWTGVDGFKRSLTAVYKELEESNINYK
ncbi:MBL fold metallo-hydrolase [Falsibacillus pallidus]|uniref:MBL fold metallo-hydrolase n=1 Tax=Falsibacillus pallidus TaxID=493781 RepID=UPI003D96463F